MRLRPNFFDTKNNGHRNNFDFLTVFFLKFLTFLENYPYKSEILGSIEITGCVNSFCISGYAVILYRKSFDFL